MLQCARGQCCGCAGARFWGRGVRWWGCASSPQCHPRRLIGFRKRVRACARSRACEFASVRFAACRQILALPRRGCDAVGLQDASCPLRQHKRATRGEEQRSCDREPKERVPVREQTAARTCGRKRINLLSLVSGKQRSHSERLAQSTWISVDMKEQETRATQSCTVVLCNRRSTERPVRR
jgi:hypothetical protein